ncbi:MAG: hypothetical protein ABIZ34_04885 [Candidatus Limnocylindrales bacterium]
MITDSPLAYRHVPSVRTFALLLGIAVIGLVLLALGAQLIDGPAATTVDGQMTAPFRWVPVDGAFG